MVASKFQQKAAPSQSKYAGIKSAGDRTPQLNEGSYRVMITGTRQSPPRPGKDTYFFLEGEVVEAEGPKASAKGSKFSAMFPISGRGEAAGVSKIKAYVLAHTGHEDDASFDAYDPNGQFLEALIDGKSNDMSADVLEMVNNPIDVDVYRDKDLDNGDYFRGYNWSHVDES